MAQHGLSVLALADSGASVCVISDSFAASHRLLVVPVTPKLLRTACGRTINVSGMVYLSFLVESRMYRARFLVVPELVDSIILGRDFLRHNSLVLCVGGGRTRCSNELHGLTLGPLASFNPHPGLGTPPPHGDVKVSDFFGGCSFHGSLGCCGGGVCSFSGGSSEQMVGAIRPPLAYPVAEWVCPVDTSSNPPPVSTDPLSLLDIPQAVARILQDLSPTVDGRLVPPPEERRRLWELVHQWVDHSTARTREVLGQLVCWKGMSGDLHVWSAQCACQAYAPPRTQPHTDRGDGPPPLHSWMVDFYSWTGPHPFRLLVAVELTLFVTVLMIVPSNCNTSRLQSALMVGLFMAFPTPVALYFDDDTLFSSSFQAWLTSLSITPHLLPTRSHAWAAEIANSRLHRLLHHVPPSFLHPELLPTTLVYMQYLLNTVPLPITHGIMPYALLSRLPANPLLGGPSWLKPVEVAWHVDDLQFWKKVDRPAAFEFKFKPGQLVWCQLVAWAGSRTKVEPYWIAGTVLSCDVHGGVVVQCEVRGVVKSKRLLASSCRPREVGPPLPPVVPPEPVVPPPRLPWCPCPMCAGD